jgi:hypothetical protein
MKKSSTLQKRQIKKLPKKTKTGRPQKRIERKTKKQRGGYTKTIDSDTIEIHDREYFGDSFIEEVIFSANTIKIGNLAFAECKNLKKVVFPEDSKLTDMVGFSIFKGCITLIDVVLPKKLNVISRLSFYNCLHLKTMHFPDNLTIIESNAFRQCNNLKKIDFPKTLTKIGSFAFYESGLTTITFHTTEILPKIENNAFNRCEFLNEIFVTDVEIFGHLLIEKYPEWEYKIKKIGTVSTNIEKTDIELKKELDELYDEWNNSDKFTEENINKLCNDEKICIVTFFPLNEFRKIKRLIRLGGKCFSFYAYIFDERAIYKNFFTNEKFKDKSDIDKINILRGYRTYLIKEYETLFII